MKVIASVFSDIMHEDNLLIALPVCCHRETQDAGSEEDISPRTRAMSRYLSGRLGSSGLPSPAQSSAATPEKLQAHAPVLDTPPQAVQNLAPAAEDSSPPRVSGPVMHPLAHASCSRVPHRLPAVADERRCPAQIRPAI